MQQQRAHIKFKSLNTISADSIDYIVDNLQLLNRAVKYTKKQARGQYRNPTLINVKSYESCYPTVEYGQTQILLYPGYLRYLIIGHPINNRVNAPKYFNINITQCDGQELTLPQIEFGQTHKLEEYWDLYSLGVVSGSCIRKITVEWQNNKLIQCLYFIGLYGIILDIDINSIGQ
ncbi:hypothetical protein SS50377_25466 [Spironucleus salmonicida]|nr:hypothetical protein SS50377_25466 [Spironucleus salmonicida]